ncbi:hypothetical protein BT69DRAFT_677782 [Atractiella rhizophila]|nr:hypothetical protein BT69DRAFT_677782 [Atractiella rhizophila]
MTACQRYWTKSSVMQNEEYARELRSHPKTLMLVDSETGAPIGELAAGVDINEMLGAQSLRKSRSNVSIGAASRRGDGNAEPVVVTLPSDWDPSHHPSIQVETVSHAQAKGRMGGKYDDSKVVVMSNVISRGIVLASEKLSTQMEGATNKWIDRKREEMREREANGEPPLEQSPLVFHPLAKEGVQKTYQATQQVVNFSSATISHLSTTASRFGDRVGRSLKFGDGSGSGQPNKSAGAFKSALGKTLVAIGNVADGLGTGTKNVVDAAGNSSTTIISHKYGDEAGEVARQVGGIIKGVVVVYVDARGVVRQVVLKSAGKSAIKAQMSDGRQVVLESNPNDYFDPEKQMPERNMPLKTPIKPINLVKGAMR